MLFYEATLARHKEDVGPGGSVFWHKNIDWYVMTAQKKGWIHNTVEFRVYSVQCKAQTCSHPVPFWRNMDMADGWKTDTTWWKENLHSKKNSSQVMLRPCHCRHHSFARIADGVFGDKLHRILSSVSSCGFTRKNILSHQVSWNAILQCTVYSFFNVQCTVAVFTSLETVVEASKSI